MKYHTLKAKCQLCGSEFTGRGMTKHVRSCLTRHLKNTSGEESKTYLYLRVNDAFNSDYFLHLLLTDTSTFAHLDSFLRRTWVECCGHLSSFSFERYGDEIDMGMKLKQLCSPDAQLIYQYDFGSTTELIIKVMGYLKGIAKKKDRIQIISRNTAPVIPCTDCGKAPAVLICTECAWGGDGWLCDKCAEDHACGEEMFLPVVNSPRTGVCGYTGEGSVY